MDGDFALEENGAYKMNFINMHDLILIYTCVGENNSEISYIWSDLLSWTEVYIKINNRLFS